MNSTNYQLFNVGVVVIFPAFPETSENVDIFIPRKRQAPPLPSLWTTATTTSTTSTTVEQLSSQPVHSTIDTNNRKKTALVRWFWPNLTPIQMSVMGMTRLWRVSATAVGRLLKASADAAPLLPARSEKSKRETHRSPIGGLCVGFVTYTLTQALTQTLTQTRWHTRWQWVISVVNFPFDSLTRLGHSIVVILCNRYR